MIASNSTGSYEAYSGGHAPIVAQVGLIDSMGQELSAHSAGNGEAVEKDPRVSRARPSRSVQIVGRHAQARDGQLDATYPRLPALG